MDSARPLHALCPGFGHAHTEMHTQTHRCTHTQTPVPLWSLRPPTPCPHAQRCAPCVNPGPGPAPFTPFSPGQAAGLPQRFGNITKGACGPGAARSLPPPRTPRSRPCTQGTLHPTCCQHKGALIGAGRPLPVWGHLLQRGRAGGRRHSAATRAGPQGNPGRASGAGAAPWGSAGWPDRWTHGAWRDRRLRGRGPCWHRASSSQEQSPAARGRRAGPGPDRSRAGA